MTTYRPHPKQDAASVLDALTQLLDLAAKAQEAQSARTGDFDRGVRASKATELAAEIREISAALTPPYREPDTGEIPRDGYYGVTGDWRRMLNRALTHAQLGIIE